MARIRRMGNLNNSKPRPVPKKGRQAFVRLFFIFQRGKYSSNCTLVCRVFRLCKISLTYSSNYLILILALVQFRETALLFRNDLYIFPVPNASEAKIIRDFFQVNINGLRKAKYPTKRRYRNGLNCTVKIISQ
jgi:hypothetical protein